MTSPHLARLFSDMKKLRNITKALVYISKIAENIMLG